MSILTEPRPMAKKHGRVGRPPSPEPPRRNILNLRGRDEFKDWLVKFSKHEHEDMADLIFEGLRMLAESRGFEAPPAR